MKPIEWNNGESIDAGLLHAESSRPRCSVLQEIAENNSIFELMAVQQISSQNSFKKRSTITAAP